MAAEAAPPSLHAVMSLVMGGAPPEAVLQNLRFAEEAGVLTRSLPDLHSHVSALHPASHSLAAVYLLDVLACAPGFPTKRDLWLSQATIVMTEADPAQICLIPDKYASLCKAFTDVCVAIHQPKRAIMPLRIAIEHLRPTPEHLTPMHAELCKVSILAKCYASALPVLDQAIYDVEPRTTAVGVQDYLLYCYYGGMVYTGVKRYHRALELFHHAFTAPALSLSAIAVAAYKKYIVLSLITHGQVPSSFPKYTSAVVQRNAKTGCQEYLELSTSYAARNVEDLKRVIDNHTRAFDADGNLGLAKQCIDSLHSRNIQRLTQTYLTLSLRDIARSVRLESDADAERRILHMIEDGDIFATINQKDGMVSFNEDSQQYNTWETTKRLEHDIERVMHIASKLQAADEQIATDRNYLSKLSKDRHGRWGGTEADEFELAGKMFDPLPMP